MALPGLVKVSILAKLLGMRTCTALIWCRRLGVPLARCPVRGMPKCKPEGTIPKGGPLYISVEQAAQVLDYALPGLANLAERRDMYRRLRFKARADRQASRNVVNEIIWTR